jgi:hypothetical protein
MALSASAQAVDKNKDNTETVKITVSGGWDIDFVFRSKELADALIGVQRDTTTLEANANVRLDIDLTEKVSVVVNLATERLDNGFVSGFLGSSLATGDDGLDVVIWDLAVKMQEVLDPAITIQLGTQNDFMFDVRGKGSPLFFAPGHSTSMATKANSGDTTGNSDYMQPSGAVVWYNREAAHFALALLPAIIEGGDPGNDEAAYAATLYYDLDSVGKGSRLGVILCASSLTAGAVGSSTSSIITIGAGASLKGLGGMEGLEVFAEFYFQSGDVGSTGDAGGTAFHLGGHYDLQGDSAPWVEVQFTMLSGDDDFVDTDIDSFLSYENVNDLLIIEGQLFGFNWNTNMTTIKIMGGMSFTAGGGAKNNVSLSGALGICKTSEDVGVAPNDTDKLGTEFDVKLTYWFSKAVSFDVNLGFLSGSDVLELATFPTEDSASVFTVGMTGKF